MRLLILSDLHRELWYRSQTWYEGKIDPFPKTDLAVARPDVVILAGDIDGGYRAVEWADEVFASLPVIYVHGNHEGYGERLDDVQKAIAEACAATSHVHYLNCREIIIAGVRFLGTPLWTDFRLHGDEDYPGATRAAGRRMNDYRLIRLGAEGRLLIPSDTEAWHMQQRRWLQERLARPHPGKTVVVTHMAPSERSVADKYKNDTLTPAFASNLEALVEHADLWVHGHMHNPSDYNIGRCRVVCNPLGYPGRDDQPENPNFDPDFIIEI